MTEHASSLGNVLRAPAEAEVLDRTTVLGAGLLAALVVLPHFPLQATNYAIGTGVSFELCLRLVVCAACGIYGLRHVARSSRRLEKFPLAWCVLFGVWSMFSLLGAADLRVGTVACGVYWCVLVFLPAIVSQLGKERTLLVLLASSMLYVVGQWALFLAGSELGSNVEVSEAGEVLRLGSDSQALAFYAALLVGLTLVLGRRLSPRPRWLILAVAVVTLAGARSRTAVLATIVASGLLLLRQMDRRGRRAVVLGAAALASLVMVVVGGSWFGEHGDEVASALARTGDSDEIWNASGRLEIWPLVFGKIARSPVLGYGYGCSGVTLGDLYVVDELQPLRHAHSELLNVVLCTGWFGGLLLAAMLLQQALAFWRRPDALPDYILVLVFIAGLTEPVLLTPMPSVLTIAWIVAMLWRNLDAPSAGITSPAAMRMPGDDPP